MRVNSDAEQDLLALLRDRDKNDRHGFCPETRLMFLPQPHSSPYQRLARAGITNRALEASSLAQNGPPQYRGSGWSGARSGQDPSEVLGGPAAASGEIRRGQPKSGQFLALGQIRRGQPQKPSA